uniref:Gem-associated protein 5 second beta-propeller domain-containing protein n=1 Tax=Trichogramma kaykai TaxID=54128 RepID=A0ABD2VX53_9HYME
MNEVILPPSPNSRKSSILACADDGTVCWGAKKIIVVAKPDKEYGSMNYFFIHEADTKIVTTLAFLPISKDGILRLVSGGDNVLRIWNLNNFTKEQENRELDESDSVVAVDCFKQNAHLIACVSKSQYLIIWNILLNSTKLINLGEVRATCLSCCPHNSYIVSIGTRCGLIYVVDIQGSDMPCGELVSWEYSVEVKKVTSNLIHNKHSKLIYCIAALVDNTYETNENGQVENLRTTNNIKSIWTVSRDNQIICCNLTNNQTCFDYIITSQKGYASCLDTSPIDTTQIAMGVSDLFVRRWDFSKTHETTFIPQMLNMGRLGEASALAWHPEKPNILAFGTYTGYIGVFDIDSENSFTSYMYYRNDVVHSIGWGPAPDIHDFALYACVNKKLIYYNREKINDALTSVKTKNCTEFNWKSDKSLLAVGFSDGVVPQCMYYANPLEF